MDNFSTAVNQVITVTTSLTDVLDHIMRREISEFTRRDYLRQIRRCQQIYRVNSLDDVSADIGAFYDMWPQHRYDTAHFASRSIYAAWRRKMVSILREFHGHAAATASRRQRCDDWAVLSERVSVALSDHPHARKLVIPLSVLIDEARWRSLTPKELTHAALDAIIQECGASRRTSVRGAVRLLTRLAMTAPDIAEILPPGGIGDLGAALRLHRHQLPAEIEAKIEIWVGRHCDGEQDFITGEQIGTLSTGATGVHRAALRKYVCSALLAQAVDEDISDLRHAFKPEIIRVVLRAWAGETNRTHRISPRTIAQYCQSLMVLLRANSGDPALFSDAMRSRLLRDGQTACHSMSPDVQKFCMRLVTDRHLEMTFRSLHRQFQRRSIEAMTAGNDVRAVQLGVLAAFCAIELWAVPLRISNALQLRIFGPQPSVYLPKSASDALKIQISASDVKNRKGVRAELRPGRDRALEVLRWYIEKIRPQIPSAARSRGLFPGWKSEFLTASALRGWLYEHSADLGLPMTPHNMRHGQASLYLRHHPGDYAAAARLLGDTEATVRKFYAWLDQQAELDRVQSLIASSAGIA